MPQRSQRGLGLGEGEHTSRLSGVSRTVTPASTLPTVRETSIMGREPTSQELRRFHRFRRVIRKFDVFESLGRLPLLCSMRKLAG